MKIIKINTDHYIQVNDSKIKKGDCVFLSDEIYYVTELNEDFIILDNQTMNSHIGVECERYKSIKKITHSTQPLGKPMLFTNAFESDLAITTMGLHDTVIENWGCKKLSLSEVKELIGEVDLEKKAEEVFPYKETRTDFVTEECREIYKIGYNQALEDNKEKKYTEEDMLLFAAEIIGKLKLGIIKEVENVKTIIQSFQPKTEWEVEYDENGKLKLV